MEWNRAIAVALVGAMLAPTVALAESYPRSVTINGHRCQQSLNNLGARETWCMIDGRPTKLKEPTAEESAAAVYQANFRADVRAAAEGGRISAHSAELLSDAAVKYSWSGPLKWSAIFGTVGATLLLAQGDESTTNSGLAILGIAAVNLGLALIIDSAARRDIDEALGRNVPRR